MKFVEQFKMYQQCIIYFKLNFEDRNLSAYFL